MSDLEAERHARVMLNKAAEPGSFQLAQLVTEVGAVLVRDQLAAAHETKASREIAGRLAQIDPEVELRRAEQRGLRYVIPGDDEWPVQLDVLDQCEPLQRSGGTPLGLWVRGPLRLDTLDSSVAVVGSRSSTSYGNATARDIAGDLADAGVAVVSGAAAGIDDAAHRGSLARDGRTVAVLACGADRVYPAANHDVISHLGQHFAIISEMAPGSSPMRMRFLSRNRIIAALARGTLVVEAAVRSGALNTSNWATRLHRPVMAVPGPVTSISSQGTHHLIRSGAAVLVGSGRDVLEEISAMGEHLGAEPRAPERLRDRLTHRQARVLDAVPVARHVSVASIAHTASVELDAARQALDVLRSVGLVEESEAGWRITPAAHD